MILGGGGEQAQNGGVGTVSQSAGWAEMPMGAPDQNAGLPSAFVFIDGPTGLLRTPEGTGSRERLESRFSELGRTSPVPMVVGLVKPSSKPWLPPAPLPSWHWAPFCALLLGVMARQFSGRRPTRTQPDVPGSGAGVYGHFQQHRTLI